MRRWLEDDEPRLSGRLASRLRDLQRSHRADADDLRELQAGLELLIEPYVTRETADAPDGAASVRILAYFMPEASAP